MKNLLNNFRNFLHTSLLGNYFDQTALKLISNYFSQQNRAFLNLKFNDYYTVIQLQSLFSEKRLKLYLEEFNLSDQELFSLYLFGQFLVSESLLSNNPAEKILIYSCNNYLINSNSLRELSKTKLLKVNSIYNNNHNNSYQNKFFRLNYYFLKKISFFSVLCYNLIFLLTFFNLIINPILVKNQPQNDKLWLFLKAKPVHAKSKINDLDNLNNLFDQPEIVSSSAKIVTTK